MKDIKIGQVLQYIGLLPKALKNPLKVLEGIVNSVKIECGNLPDDELNEIVRRRVICESCRFMSENAKIDPIQMYKTNRVDKFCIHCDCNINLKTASLESECGLTEWNKKKPHNQIPLKWEKYNKNVN